LNWLDIVILIIVALFCFGGLKNGIIRTVVSMAGLIAGIALAGRYYLLLASALTFISDSNIANIAAFIIILAAVLVVSGIIATVLSGLVKAILLSWLNALLGGVFGFIIGAIATSVILAIWVKFLGPNDAITESKFAGFLLGYFPFVLSLLPADFSSISNFFR